METNFDNNDEFFEEKKDNNESSASILIAPPVLSDEEIKKEKKKLKKKQEKLPVWVNFLVIALACCMLFSCLQSIYIFALSTGRVGNMSYASNNDGKLESISSTSGSQVSNTNYEFVNDPNFSLEEASSVYDPNKETLTTMEIVQKVSPATVSIFITEESDNNLQTISSGTGFIISEDGYVVTNAHVISSVLMTDNQTIYVKLPSSEDMIEARIVGSDEQTDTAVIKLTKEQEYPYVTLGDSSVLQVGEMVVAIGNSLGSLDGTVTSGIVSALDREISNNGYMMRLIQTDASINSGNSGGPLINSFGEVIGITNAKMSSAEGLGFAIPISSVKDVIESLINYGYVTGRPYLGISVAQVASNSYYGAIEGVYIGEISEGGPADNGQFEVGDIIRSIDGVEITRSSDIIDVRDAHKVGDVITFVLERDGHTIEVDLTIGDSSQANESN